MVRLLVSTSQHLLEVVVDENYQLVERKPWMSNRTFFGQTLLPSGEVFVMFTEDPFGPKNQPVFFLWLDPSDGSVIDQKPADESLIQPHQALWFRDGIYITNTGQNAIRIMKDNGSTVEVPLGEYREDVNHLNSLFAKDDRYLYVMAHNGLLPENIPGQIIRLDFEKEGVKIFDLPHRKAHDIVIRESAVYYNGSDNGRVIRLDSLGSMEYEEVVIGGHPKGMAWVGKGVYCVGSSEWTPFAQRRAVSHAQLFFISTHNEFRAIESLELAVGHDPAGHINDILLLDSKA
jgi:hypothetical protein